jgi:hypothetical protein
MELKEGIFSQLYSTYHQFQKTMRLTERNDGAVKNLLLYFLYTVW